MPYTVTGKVIEGKRLGRQLGFPTANVAVEGSEVPEGVYAVRAEIDGRKYEGMASVAARGGGRLVEVNLFGFEGDLYGTTMTVELLEYIRPMRKFTGTQQLRQAVEGDREEIKEFFKTK